VSTHGSLWWESEAAIANDCLIIYLRLSCNYSGKPAHQQALSSDYRLPWGSGAQCLWQANVCGNCLDVDRLFKESNGRFPQTDVGWFPVCVHHAVPFSDCQRTSAFEQVNRVRTFSGPSCILAGPAQPFFPSMSAASWLFPPACFSPRRVPSDLRCLHRLQGRSLRGLVFTCLLNAKTAWAETDHFSNAWPAVPCANGSFPERANQRSTDD